MAQTCPICNNTIQDGEAACPKCGFRMPGATQSFAPVKIDLPGETNARTPTQNHELVVVRGPQTGIRITLREGAMSVGRDPRCDVFLNDMTVSRDHARLETGEKGCMIYDCNSFNGTWVNDRMVENCLLQPDDLIQIGAFCLVYKEL